MVDAVLPPEIKAVEKVCVITGKVVISCASMAATTKAVETMRTSMVEIAGKVGNLFHKEEDFVEA